MISAFLSSFTSKAYADAPEEQPKEEQKGEGEEEKAEKRGSPWLDPDPVGLAARVELTEAFPRQIHVIASPTFTVKVEDDAPHRISVAHFSIASIYGSVAANFTMQLRCNLDARSRGHPLVLRWPTNTDVNQP